MIDLLSNKENIVLATGGGAILDGENRRCLKKRGVVVYLRASILQQVQRTSRDKTRPLLQTSDVRRKIQELMEFREPFYREVADIVIDTNDGNPRHLGNEICKRVQELSR